MKHGLHYNLSGAQFHIAPDGTLTAHVVDPTASLLTDDDGFPYTPTVRITILPRDVLGLALLFRMPAVWRFLQRVDREWQAAEKDREIAYRDGAITVYERMEQEWIRTDPARARAVMDAIEGQPQNGTTDHGTD